MNGCFMIPTSSTNFHSSVIEYSHPGHVCQALRARGEGGGMRVVVSSSQSRQSPRGSHRHWYATVCVFVLCGRRRAEELQGWLQAFLWAMAEDSLSEFTHRAHVFYFRDALLEQLPSPYEPNDVNRLTLAYFAVSALDLLNALDQVCAMMIFLQAMLLLVRCHSLRSVALARPCLDRSACFVIAHDSRIGLFLWVRDLMGVMYCSDFLIAII